MGLFKEFSDRGMIAQATNQEAIEKMLDNEKVVFYVGFDPTAYSLHIGHFIQLKIMAHMQRAGHMPIAIFGTGTAMVGDPSGKNDMRRMMTPDEINNNVEQFKKQMSKFIDISDGKALFINNGDWLNNLNYIEFLRDVGPHFSINRMLAAECYKSRLETGLTFLEFNYMLMQSYDFYRLFCDYGCRLQFGGDDQWSNIIGGVELVRRKTGKEVYGLTFKLLLTSDGRKMGKTEKGALWLDPEKTPPYDFFQYWRNIDDADVINCMKMLTFMPLEEIAEYEKMTGSELNVAKEKLAYELTALIHSKEEADRALETARQVFSGAGRSENMPTTEIASTDFVDGVIAITELLCKSKLAPSKAEAKRLIQQGGVMLNNKKVERFDATVAIADFDGKEVIIKKGKKTYHRFVLA
ncbi:MAG: tyrosine--tRNA ligase [Clostridiales bacterium]|nr:tyrosine--tRNA ligase [Clostridiales bacterium]